MEKDTLWEKTLIDLKKGLLSKGGLEGARFPSLTELSHDYGISKITALRVVSELEREGLVRRIPRRGTFIVGRYESRVIKVLMDFDRDWAANALPIIWRYIRGVEAACRAAKYHMEVMSLAHEVPNPDGSERYILLAPDPESHAYLSFAESGCRHVFLHSPVKLDMHNCVRANHYLGGKLMTNHMVLSGHKRIAYVGGPADSVWHASRISGYIDALGDAGIDIDNSLLGEIVSSVPRADDTELELSRLLALPEPPTAIVASDDLRALAIIAYLEGAGIRIPEQIAVSGMDSRPEATRRGAPITTCDWQLERQGEMAVDMLIFPPVSCKAGHEILIDPKFIEGRTA